MTTGRIPVEVGSGVGRAGDDEPHSIESHPSLSVQEQGIPSSRRGELGDL